MLLFLDIFISVIVSISIHICPYLFTSLSLLFATFLNCIHANTLPWEFYVQNLYLNIIIKCILESIPVNNSILRAEVMFLHVANINHNNAFSWKHILFIGNVCDSSLQNVTIRDSKNNNDNNFIFLVKLFYNKIYKVDFSSCCNL